MPDKLPRISGAQAIRALERLGFSRRRQKGSHVVMRKEDRMLVVPLHKELKSGTLRHIIRQSGVSREEFLDSM